MVEVATEWIIKETQNRIFVDLDLAAEWRSNTWGCAHLIHFILVLHFTWKSVIWFAVQIKWFLHEIQHFADIG